LNIGVGILTYNEIEGLKKIFDKIPDKFLPYIFAVDGGSTDGTIEFLKSKGVHIYGQLRKGRGEAFRIAFEKTDFDAIVFFSPDGNEDPNDIEKLAKEIEKGADMAIATRMTKNSRNEEDINLFRPRKWVNQLLTLAANLIWNRSFLIGHSKYITDTINGFRAIGRDAFYEAQADEDGVTIEYQLSIRFMKLKKNIVEIPTIEGPRIGGESYAKAWPTGKQFVKLLFREIYRK